MPGPPPPPPPPPAPSFGSSGPPPPPPMPLMTNNNNGNARVDLLKSIQNPNGIKLKKVKEEDKRDRSTPIASKNIKI
jgi:hypothetical protein